MVIQKFGAKIQFIKWPQPNGSLWMGLYFNKPVSYWPQASREGPISYKKGLHVEVFIPFSCDNMIE